MPLIAGSRLGPYQVLAQLGAGGMGEVYRARDTRLNRDVAVNVLPEIVYLKSDRLMSVAVDRRTLLEAEPPREVVQLPPFSEYFAMSPDGARFLVVYGDGNWAARELHVVQNWFETLQRRAAGIP
jgi:serine/threonine protein kinase